MLESYGELNQGMAQGLGADAKAVDGAGRYQQSADQPFGEGAPPFVA